MIRCLSNIVELKDYYSLWAGLGGQDVLCVFQTYDWVELAWSTCLSAVDGNRLYVLVWSQENLSDVVVFPFYIDANGTLRLIMDEHSDMCDCIYKRGRNHHIAFKEAWEHIQSDKTIKRILFSKLLPQSELLNYFGSLIHSSCICPINSHSWIEVLPCDDFPASQPQLRSKDKANVRAIKRKADKYRLRVLSKATGDEYPQFDIDTLVSEMKKRGWREPSFMTGCICDFCRGLYEREIAYIIELVASDENPVALNFILKLGSRRLSWIFLYSDCHSSTELYVKYFYSNTSSEPITFDFGTGGYEYKLGTFRPCMRLLFSLTVELEKIGKIKAALKSVVRAMKNFVKVIIGWF